MSPGELHLLRPGWLLALLPLALLLWRLRRADDRGGGPWRTAVDAHLLPLLLVRAAGPGRRLGFALLTLGLAAGVLALAGPAWTDATEVAYRRDAARVLLLDLSPVRDAADASAERARLKLLDLLRAAPPGQTALVAYAEEPYLIAPLTTDGATIALLVPELTAEIIPVAGDRPERGLRMAARVLERSGARLRDVVWLTGGPSAPTAIAEATAALAAQGVRLSVLHAGSDGSAPLRAAAEASGGLYLSMGPDDADVRRLAALLAKGGSWEAAGYRAGRRARELGPWLVLLLLPLAALAFRRGVLGIVALPLLLAGAPPAEALELGGLWADGDRRAMQELDAGRAEAAAALFTDPRWRAVALYRAGHYAEAAAALEPLRDFLSLYNRGNALARLGRLEEAAASYAEALRRRQDDADARHNRDLVQAILAARTPPAGEADDGDGTSAANDAPPGGEAGDGGEAPDDTAGPDGESAAAGGSAPADSGRDAPRPPPERAPEMGETAAGDRPETAAGPAETAAGEATAADGPVDPARGEEPVGAPPAPAAGDPEREARLLAEQWLRRAPDGADGLLQRKLRLEHERRLQQGDRPWE